MRKLSPSTAAVLIVVTVGIVVILLAYQQRWNPSSYHGYQLVTTRVPRQNELSALYATENRPAQPIIPHAEVKLLKDISKHLFVSNYAPKKYKRGKTVIYESLYKCEHPDFLTDYRSPCWKSKRDAKKGVFCAPRVAVVGFHKCGTTDSSKWFKNSKYSYRNQGFLKEALGNTCPIPYMESYAKMVVTHPNMTTFGDCPGCMMLAEVLRIESDSIVVHSIFQYLQYFKRDETKYIATIRHPTDRLLSQYFYLFKFEKEYEPYAKAKNVEELGYDVLHEAAAKTIDTLTACLKNYGITDCILSPERNNMHDDSFFAKIMKYSCYSVFISEALKFVPKELIYFSRMEDYAEHPEKFVPEIFKFVGEEVPDLGLAKKVENQGVKIKPVHQKTIDLLDKFYQPFNDDLAEILDNDKWRYIRNES